MTDRTPAEQRAIDDLRQMMRGHEPVWVERDRGGVTVQTLECHCGVVVDPNSAFTDHIADDFDALTTAQAWRDGLALEALPEWWNLNRLIGARLEYRVVAGDITTGKETGRGGGPTIEAAATEATSDE